MFDNAKDDGRCIIVAEGYYPVLPVACFFADDGKFSFYEWKNINSKKKIPYFTKRKDGKLMLFAGLCDTSNVIQGSVDYAANLFLRKLYMLT